MKRRKQKTVRVSLDLSEEFFERLEKLEDLVQAGSKADVIREALRLHEYFAKETRAGWDVYLVKGQESVRVKVLGTV